MPPAGTSARQPTAGPTADVESLRSTAGERTAVEAARPTTTQHPPAGSVAADPAPQVAAARPWSLWWAAALGNADWHLTTPLLLVLAAALHSGLASVTASVGAHAFGHGLALPLWGLLADRYGPRAVLRTGLVLAALASVGSALATDAPGWLVARLLTGAAFAVVTPCVSLYHDASGGTGVRHRRFAELMTVTSASAVLAPLLADASARLAAWRLLFLAVAAFAALAAVRTGALPRLPATPRPPRGIGGLLRRPALWLILGVGAVEGAVLMGLPALLVPALMAAGTPTPAGPVVAVYGLSVCLSTLLVRRHAARRTARAQLVTGGLLGVAGALAMAAAQTATTAFLAAVLLGGAWGFLHTTLQTWLPRRLPHSARGTAASFFATSGVLASSLAVTAAAPLLSGTGGRCAVFLVAAALGAVLTAVLARTAVRWT